MTAEELRVQLAERKSEVGEEVEVRIRGDRGAPYKHVEPVLLACARVGIWNVKFANFPKESGR